MRKCGRSPASSIDFSALLESGLGTCWSTRKVKGAHLGREWGDELGGVRLCLGLGARSPWNSHPDAPKAGGCVWEGPRPRGGREGCVGAGGEEGYPGARAPGALARLNPVRSRCSLRAGVCKKLVPGPYCSQTGENPVPATEGKARL